MAGGGSQTSTVYQSNLPEYAKPYFESMMDRTLGESERPYQSYPGQRIAGMAGETEAGLQGSTAFGTTTPGYAQAGGNLAANAGNVGLSASGYTPGTVTNAYTGPVQGDYAAGNFNADQVQSGVFNPAVRDYYMSPYMDAVTGRAKESAALDYARQAALEDANAGTTGAFGGSRYAVQQAIGRQGLQDRLTDIQTQGLQSAFENAQQQFERDRGASMTAQQANQNANLEAQKLGEQSRQYGYGATEDAYRTAGQMGLDAQKANEQFGLQALEAGLQGANIANQSAATLGDTQKTVDAAIQDRLKSLLGVGQAREEYEQRGLDLAYDDFINQRDAERQNLQFLSSILRGVPISANQNVVTSETGNNLQGLLGSATGLQALYNLQNS